MPETLKHENNISKKSPEGSLESDEIKSDTNPRQRTQERMARVVLVRIRRALFESREKYLLRKQLRREKRRAQKAEKKLNREKKKLGGVVLNQVKKEGVEK